MKIERSFTQFVSIIRQCYTIKALLHYATLCSISRLTTMSPMRKVTEKAEFYTTLS